MQKGKKQLSDLWGIRGAAWFEFFAHIGQKIHGGHMRGFRFQFGMVFIRIGILGRYFRLFRL